MSVQADSVPLLAQADLLLLVSRLLSPPTSESRAELADAVSCCGELFERAGIPRQEMSDGGPNAIEDQLRALDDSLWAEEYVRLFECAVPCPINECGYVRRDKGAILGDVAGFYNAFGFKLADGASERVDHLVCQLEFFAMLLVMLAKAHEDRNHEGVHVTTEAIGSFAFDHIGQWLPSFCAKLKETATLAFYLEVAELLSEAWNGICSHHGIPIFDDKLEICPEDDPGTPYECGMAQLRPT
jgi:TorA maturation chaperone TorD